MTRRLPSGGVDLAATVALALAGVAVAFAPGVAEPLRVAVELPLVLVLPGYALMAAAVPRPVLGAVDRLVFALGSSVAVAILAGLVLDVTSWGLRRTSWAVALAGVTVAAAAVAAFVRRPGSSRRDAASAAPAPGPVLLFCAAALLALAAVGIARSGALRSEHASSFTQLWMLPTRVQGERALRIGVVNHEGVSKTYRVVTHAGSTVLASWPRIVVPSGGRWSRTVVVPASPSARTRIETDVYRAEAPNAIYRSVTAWVKTAGASG
jgi:uncharacterized membrane protein